MFNHVLGVGGKVNGLSCTASNVQQIRRVSKTAEEPGGLCSNLLRAGTSGRFVPLSYGRGIKGTSHQAFVIVDNDIQ